MVELISITPDPERVIAEAACASRLSQKRPEEVGSFVRRLVEARHLSVLRHAFATFRISEISRACADQILRHTHLQETPNLLGAIQESQRYVDQRNHGYIIPPSLTEEQRELYVQAVENALRIYADLVDSGVPREDARFVLPMGIHTTLVVSGNFQAWWDFLARRLGSEAQWEIRQVAHEILDILVAHAPNVFEEFLWGGI